MKTVAGKSVPETRAGDSLWRVVNKGSSFNRLALSVLAVLAAFAFTAVPISLSGKNPAVAYWALLRGAFGSVDAITFALNKSTPYILAGVGVAMCFRARIINIGGEGQIAVGGIVSSWIILTFPDLMSSVLIPLALVGAALAGAVWAGLPAMMRLRRGVHEVLSTLMLNFVGTLLVGEVLNGTMGEPGAGFPQSPLFPESGRLPILLPQTDLHSGILLALIAVVSCHFVLWYTPFGFRLRVLGSSSSAAIYAGISLSSTFLSVMLLSGALAGVAGGIEVMGIHYRLIEGFSSGFGFNAVAVALLGALNPLAILPSGLFFGFLEAGSLAMQREVGVPSSLVYVIEGVTMICVLCAMGFIGPRSRS
ncbi:MAG: ABC transporter permease [Verrucomicrobia bacterium]|nr:ABC transporter permease [Verrucomicrobiota bacterium]